MDGDNLRDQETGKPLPSLTARTFGGFLWAVSGAGSQAVLKIAVLAVLARLLDPGQFGVIGAALTVVALAELFGQVGVAPAVIQAKTLDDITIRTASTITILTGFGAGLLLFLSAPMMAAIFQIAEVEPVIQVFSIIFVISGFAVVPEALLQRRMQFRTIALVTLGSYCLGYAIPSIVLAYQGIGYWALVWGQVLQYLFASAAYIAIERPAMRPLLDRQAMRHLFRFGAGVTLSRFGNYVALNADRFLIGRSLGADALGFYTRAYTLLVQPAQLVGTVAEKVLFPALSSVQGDKDRLLRGYNRAIALIAMTNMPLTAVLVVLGPEIIHLLLGAQWDFAILPFQIMVASLVFRTAYKLTGTLLRARGSVYILALWQWLYAAMVIVFAWIGLPYGIVGVSIGVSLAIFGAYWVGVWFTGFSAGTSALSMLSILGRYLVITLVIAAVLVPLRGALVAMAQPDLVVVGVCAAVAGLVYLAIALLVPRLFGEEGIWLRGMLAPRLERVRAKLARRSSSPAE